MIERTVESVLRKSKKGILLLGPRQTGKSTLIQQLCPDLSINLAHEPTFLDFARNPGELEERIAGGNFRTVFIDEVQRLPTLLNTVQTIVDQGKTAPKFYLTGSSARKLKRGKANLLPGRIHAYSLGPLSAKEVGYQLGNMQAMSTGTLPGIWTETDPQERQKTLRTYASVYLKEEVQAEALSRNIEGFSRFLFTVAANAGQFLDLAKLASASAIARQTAARYFEILEDTLIVQRCNAFRKSEARRLVQSPRFYFFDPGVLNGLLGNFVVSPDRMGVLFEHLFFNQLCAGAAAGDQDIRISSYRTEHGAEVDFIVQMPSEVIAIEVKATQNIGKSDFRGLRSFADYYKKPHRAVIAYRGRHRKVVDGIEVLPWQECLRVMGL